MSVPTLILNPNFQIPAELSKDPDFVAGFRSKFFEEADNDIPDDIGVIIDRYNAASEVGREAMNEVFIWATGYSLPTIAARAVLDRQDAAAIHDLMTKWAEKAEWKGRI